MVNRRQFISRILGVASISIVPFIAGASVVNSSKLTDIKNGVERTSIRKEFSDGSVSWEGDLEVLTCLYCKQTVETGVGAYRHTPETKKWCRYQKAHDAYKSTPWFCSEDHLVKYLTSK